MIFFHYRGHLLVNSRGLPSAMLASGAQSGWLLHGRFLMRRNGNSPVDLAYPVDPVPNRGPNPPDKPYPPPGGSRCW